jgi:putative tryptophan/tyrosine transport system substrate-binding protein
MRRRDFINLIGSAAAAWPLAVRAQQPALPVVGVVIGGSLDASAVGLTAFRNGLSEGGYVEGKDVAIEHYALEGHFDRLPAQMEDLVRRRVAVIATPGGSGAAVAAKAATSTIPIVFGVGEDPVRLGLVANLARSGGNAKGVNFFVQEILAKRLRLLHDLVPKALRIAVLVNPTNPLVAAPTLREMQQAAPAIGLQTLVLNATTSTEIDAAFAALTGDRADALFVAADAFFVSRRVQFATLAARNGIPASYADRDTVAAGGLMSYATDTADMYRQVGLYTGKILKGAKPSDLPVTQLTKFTFVLNLQTARELGIEVSPAVLSIADEVIE